MSLPQTCEELPQSITHFSTKILMSATRNIRMVKLLLHAYLAYYQDISATASILPPVPDTAASFNATEVAAATPNLEATALGSCSCSSKSCNFSPDSCSI